MNVRRNSAESEGARSVLETDLDALRRMHADTFGEHAEDIVPLKGDASDRQIMRVRGAAHTSIGIVGPNRAENRAFLGFARTFRDSGLSVPRIYAVDGHERCYLEEDLGDLTLSIWMEEQRRAGTDSRAVVEIYGRVLAELPRFQVDAAGEVNYRLCYQYTEFGREAMNFDVRYFREMFVERLLPGEFDSSGFERDSAALIDALLEAERSYFLYRDFQSRNIMIRDGAPWFIDFQSGRRGALHYDVASLLYDSRGQLADELRQHLLDAYLDALAERMQLDRGRFYYLFEGFAVLRLMQALGAFGNLGLNRGKPEYLELIPSRLQAIAALADTAEILTGMPRLTGLFRTAAAEFHSPTS